MKYKVFTQIILFFAYAYCMIIIIIIIIYCYLQHRIKNKDTTDADILHTIKQN